MTKSLQELFNEYTNEIRFSEGLRPETIRGYGNVFTLFLRIMPEVSNLDLLTPEMLNEFFKRIRTRERIVGKGEIRVGVRNSTIKTQYSKLNAFFVWLCKKNYILENPLKGIKAPRVSYEDFKKLEDFEIHRIYSAITSKSTSTFGMRRDNCMVSLLLYCGLRKGEFISLQVRDIDLEKREITIRGETSKSKKTRIIKIHPTLILHLRDYINERRLLSLKTEYLIASTKSDQKLSCEGLKHWVESLRKKSGVRFHLHQFRHTFACKLAEANINLFKIQKMMGHADIQMTVKYTRSLKTQDMEEDIGKISYG